MLHRNNQLLLKNISNKTNKNILLMDNEVSELTLFFKAFSRLGSCNRIMVFAEFNFTLIDISNPGIIEPKNFGAALHFAIIVSEIECGTIKINLWLCIASDINICPNGVSR